MDIEISNLSVSVENKEVLKDLFLKINKGEIHVIMGPNGTGKSTLSKVLLGHPSYIVTKGDIKIDNKSILNLTTDERARLGIFLVFQNPISIEGVKNSDFLRVASNNISNENISLYDFIKEMEVYFVDLDLKKDMMHRSLNENFSGGEKKKNEILQMKMLKPKFIILDELDSGLDVDSLKIVCKNINDYINKNKDTSILMITHYEKIFEYIRPNYVHILKDGKIIKSGDISLANEVFKTGYKNINNSTSLMLGEK